VTPGEISFTAQAARSNRSMIEADCSSCDMYIEGNGVKTSYTDGRLLCVDKDKTFSGSLTFYGENIELRVCGVIDKPTKLLVDGAYKPGKIQVTKTGRMDLDQDLNLIDKVSLENHGQITTSKSIRTRADVWNSGQLSLYGNGVVLAINNGGEFTNTCDGKITITQGSASFYLSEQGTFINDGQFSISNGIFSSQSNSKVVMGPGARVFTKYLSTRGTYSGSSTMCSQIIYSNSWNNNNSMVSDSLTLEVIKDTETAGCELVPFEQICDYHCESDPDVKTEFEAMVNPVVVDGEIVQASALVRYQDYIVVAYNTAGYKFNGALQFIKDIKQTPVVEKEFHILGMEIFSLHVDNNKLYIGGSANSAVHEGGSILTYIEDGDLDTDPMSTNLSFYPSNGVISMLSDDQYLYLGLSAQEGGVQMLNLMDLTPSAFHTRSDIRDMMFASTGKVMSITGGTDLAMGEIPAIIDILDPSNPDVISGIGAPGLNTSPYHKMQIKAINSSDIGIAKANGGFTISPESNPYNALYQSPSEYGVANGLDSYLDFTFVAYGKTGIQILSKTSENYEEKFLYENSDSNNGVYNGSMNDVIYEEDHLFVPYGNGGVQILTLPFLENMCMD